MSSKYYKNNGLHPQFEFAKRVVQTYIAFSPNMM